MKKKINKKRLARQLLSNEERKLNVRPYFSDNWIERGVMIKMRVEKQQKRAHERALKRRELAKV